VKQIKSKVLNKVLLNIIAYDKIFKSIGKVKHILKQEHTTNWAFSIAILSDDVIISDSTTGELKFWNIKNNTCIATINVVNAVRSILMLPESQIAFCYSRYLEIKRVNNDFNFEHIKTIFL
jgi:hypothetical protein